ncbi:MAG TPA: peptidyl-prolyl cis-trans isomerase [Caulobacteraceae bacterium]|jgi:peptidyl-prolyl cis-trans isomerase C
MLRKASLTEGKARLVVIAGLCAAAAACAPQPAAQHPPEPGDRAVAKVNGQTIWTSDVKREAVAEGLIGPGDPLDASSDRFRQVLDEVIDTKVLAGEAVARHLDKDPLAQRRIAAARDRTLEDIMVDSVVGKAVNQQAENALYQEFLKNRTPGEVIHLRQIVTASLPDAAAVKQQLAGGAAFEAVALQKSIDNESRLKGGDLGETTTDTLPQVIGEAVKGVKLGQIVGPVKVDAGWAVLKIDDRRPEPPPTLDEVRPQLIRFITYDQIKDLVLTLRSHAKIQNLLPPPPDIPGAPAEPASAPAPSNAAPVPLKSNAVIP